MANSTDVLLNTLIRGGMSPRAAAELVNPDVPAPTMAATALPSSISAVYTQAEVTGLRTEVANLRSTVQALITALTGPGRSLS